MSCSPTYSKRWAQKVAPIGRLQTYLYLDQDCRSYNTKQNSNPCSHRKKKKKKKKAHTEVSSCISQITYSAREQLGIKVTLSSLFSAAVKSSCCIMSWQSAGRRLLTHDELRVTQSPARLREVSAWLMPQTVLTHIHVAKSQDYFTSAILRSHTESMKCKTESRRTDDITSADDIPFGLPDTWSALQ